MMIEYDGQPDTYSSVLEYISLGFTSVFLSEAIIKLLALGWKYFKDPWNQFDFLIVLVSLPDFVPNVDIPGAAVFRIFRIGRLFKLVRGAKGTA